MKYAVETHVGTIRTIAMHYVNNVPYLVSGGVDESIRLFNLSEAREQGTILFHHGDISALAFAGDDIMLSAGSDGKVVLWKTKDWSRLRNLGSHKSTVSHLCVHPSNKVALSVGVDRTLRLWNLIKGSIGFTRRLTEPALKVLFSPDAAVYALLYATSIVVCSTADGEESFRVKNAQGWNDMAYLENGEIVAVGNDKQLHLLSREGKEIRTIDSHAELRLRTVEVVKIPKEKGLHSFVVTGSSDGRIQVWDVLEEENQLLCEVKTSERLTCCASLMAKC